jgi:hypothetical protein
MRRPAGKYFVDYNRKFNGGGLIQSRPAIMKPAMGQFQRIITVFCVAFQLAACAGPSAIESQSGQRDARLARMYFLREKGMIGALGGTAAAAEIRVDGKVVGSLTNGSYFFVDRPPGAYKLTVKTALALAAFDTDVRVDAGREYFFNIGFPTSGAPGTDLLNQVAAGGKGQQMQAQNPLSTGFSGAAFYSLDPATGAAEIERLKVR